MAIIDPKTWKSETERGIFTPRSKALKELDKAIERYGLAKTQSNKDRVKQKLDAWIAYKGQGWRTSTRNKHGTMARLYDEFYAATPPKVPKRGDIDLAPSFEFSNSLAKHDVPRAFERARKLIEVAYRGIVMARGAGTSERAIYETWFGTYDANRFSTVFNNVKDIFDALYEKPIMLYYRGNGVSGPSDETGVDELLQPEAFFGAAYKRGHGVHLDQRYTHIFLGTAFFTSGVYANDSTAGVIIHELSHAICATDDVVYKGVQTYGGDLCKRLAREQPNLAIYNADSYEYLCENYQNKLFVPKALNLNLPPKASVSLNFRR